MNAIPRIQPNQRLASSKVLRVFKEEGKRYCMLVAYPQSGKSGTFQSVIRNLLVNDYVKRAIILTGSAETELRNQLVEDTKKYNGSFYEDGAIHILMRQDLEAKLPALMDGTPTLIVHEESHLVQTRGQTLHKVFAPLGITITGDDEPLRARNLYYLSVSATPFSESSDAEHLREKRVVFIKPGASYRGIIYYQFNKLIHATFNISNAKGTRKLQEVVNEYGHGKWNIIRLSAKARQNFLHFCAQYGYDVYHFTSAKEDIAINDLERAPARTSFLLVDGRLRVGKVVPKAHIGFVWENSAGVKTDTIVQGLLGRMFGYSAEHTPHGYDPESQIHAFVSPTLLQVTEAQRKRGETECEIMKYITFMEQLIGKEDDTDAVLTQIPNGTNMKKPAPNQSSGAAEEPQTYYSHLYRIPGLVPQGKTKAQLKSATCAHLQEHGASILDDRSLLQINDAQKEELTGDLEDLTIDSICARDLCKITFGSDGPARAADSWTNKKVFPIRVQRGEEKKFIILYDTKHAYILFETWAEGDQPKKVAPHTTKREIFCITHAVYPAGPQTGYTIPKDAQLKPSLMESALDNTIGDWVDWLDGRRTTRPEQCVTFGADFRMDRASYKHKNSKSNGLEKIRERLEAKHGVDIKIHYNAFSKEQAEFTIRSIEWEK